MNEKQMHLAMMITGGVLTAVAGLGAVGMLTMATGVWSIISALLLVMLAIGAAVGSTYYGRQLTGDTRAFTSTEQAVLSPKQRHDLRRARADVLMQKALIEVENERDNMIARQLEAAKPEEKQMEVHRPEPIRPVPAWEEQPKTHKHKEVWEG